MLLSVFRDEASALEKVGGVCAERVSRRLGLSAGFGGEALLKALLRSFPASGPERVLSATYPEGENVTRSKPESTLSALVLIDGRELRIYRSMGQIVRLTLGVEFACEFRGGDVSCDCGASFLR